MVGILAKFAGAAADSVPYVDRQTGFNFAEFKASYNLTDRSVMFYRIAVPATVPSDGGFDVVLQVTAPRDVGWAGMTWCGTMISCPLLAFWYSGNNVIVGSHWVTEHKFPPLSTQSTYTLLKTGTFVNNTHFQFTAKCTGCASWQSSSGRLNKLSARGNNRFAFVYGAQKPSNPSSNQSQFPVHEVNLPWVADFSQGSNPNFSTLLTKNGG